MTSQRATASRLVILAAAGIAVSAVALWLAIREVDLATAWALATGLDRGPIVAIVLVLAAQVVVRAARWQRLLPVPEGGRRVPVARIVPVTLVGYLANALLPARLGEVVRSAVLARRERLSTAETLGSSILERVIDTLVLATIGVAAAVALGVTSGPTAQLAVAGFLLATIGLGGLAVAPRLLARVPGSRLPALDRLAGIARRVGAGAGPSGRARLGRAAALSAVAWALDASIYWLVAQSMGIPLGPAGAVFVSAIVVLSTAIPSAPGYVGTFELAAVAALAVLGVAGEAALAFALVAHALAVLPLAAAGAIAGWAMGVNLRRAAFLPAADRAAAP